MWVLSKLPDHGLVCGLGVERNVHSQKFRGNTKSSSLVLTKKTLNSTETDHRSKVCFFGRLWGPFLAPSGVGRGVGESSG